MAETTEQIATGSGPTEAKRVSLDPVLAGINKASDRTRQIIYLLLLTSVMSFSNTRSTRNPAWLEQRIKHYSHNYGCYLHNYKDYREDVLALDDAGASYIDKKLITCDDTKSELVSVSSALSLPAKYPPPTKDGVEQEQVRQYKEQLDELIKARVNLFNITLPIIGAQFDINDLALIACLSTLILQMILAAFQNKEGENLRMALTMGFQEQELKVLRMGQVFSVGSRSGGSNLLVRAAALWLPPIACFMVLSANWQTRGRILGLQEPYRFWIEFGFKVALLIGTLGASYMVNRSAKRINDAIDEMDDDIVVDEREVFAWGDVVNIYARPDVGRKKVFEYVHNARTWKDILPPAFGAEVEKETNTDTTVSISHLRRPKRAMLRLNVRCHHAEERVVYGVEGGALNGMQVIVRVEQGNRYVRVRIGYAGAEDRSGGMAVGWLAKIRRRWGMPLYLCRRAVLRMQLKYPLERIKAKVEAEASSQDIAFYALVQDA